MANSEVVTREDLKNVFEALGEGSYGTRIDAIEDRITTRNILYASKTNAVNATGYYEGAEITVPANSRYLILSWLTSSVGAASYPLLNNIQVMTGSDYTFYGKETRTMMHSGGGVLNAAYIATNTVACTVRVRHYNYYASAHNENTWIVGIPMWTTGLM